MMTMITMVFLILFSIALFLTGIQLYRLQKQTAIQQELIKKLSSELNVTTKTGYGLGNQILDIDKQLNKLKAQHQDILSFGTEDHVQKRTYKQASHLVQMGASIDDLKQSCELSHGEAELLAHMKLN